MGEANPTTVVDLVLKGTSVLIIIIIKKIFKLLYFILLCIICNDSK